MTEKLPYQVVKDFGSFELRFYPHYTLAQVSERGDFILAGNRGFQPLFGYIAGNNASGQKIAMTAPVLQEPVAEQNHLVSFVMPAGFDADSLPVPLGSRVQMVQVDEHFAAVISFKGGWNAERFAEKGKELLSAVKSAGLEAIGSVYWARFDPPFKPGFLKHNEVLIKVNEPKEGQK